MASEDANEVKTLDDRDWHIDYFGDWLLEYELTNERSIKTRQSELKQFDVWASERGIDEVDEITYRDIKLYVLEQSKKYADKTVEGRYDALRNCLEEATRDKEIDEHPIPPNFELSEWNIDRSKTLREKLLEKHGLTEGVSEKEYEQLRENVRPPRNRNQLLIDLLWTTGCRAGEIVQIKIDDIDKDERIIEVPDLKKKDEDATRLVRYGPQCDLVLEAWLTDRKRYQCIKDADKDWLFCSRKTAPMYPDLISEIVRETAWDAGIQEVIGQDAKGRDLHYINAHSLRHGHGTWAADRAGIHRVQYQLGHASVELTESKYVHQENAIRDDENDPYKDIF